ncbi:hypothetical protein ACWHLZ_27960 [Streptomyces chartreusis]|uniref:hypothetical protein n=1 Tax=Streptomyces chartreusis TaxID=1969 RepID=UPI0034389340
MTTATHLRTIATRWTDLTDALASTGTATWPPAGRMSDYLNALDQADEQLAEAARWQATYNRQFLDRDPTQIGATRPPLRIAILDTMRTVEAALIATGDQVAVAVQRSPMTFAPRTWPAADRARRDQLARADSVDPRRWRYGGRHTAPHTALWLLARVEARPGPFRPLPAREHRLIVNVASEACERVERALDIAGRKATIARPCPDCGGSIDMHGGAGASPVAHCTACGRTWGEQDATAAA